MNEMTFVVVRLCVILIGALIATYVIPVLKSIADEHFDEQLTGFINVAVYAAQQTITDNAEKKAYVMSQVQQWLNDRKIEITTEQISMLVEAAVLAMKIETK